MAPYVDDQDAPDRTQQQTPVLYDYGDSVVLLNRDMSGGPSTTFDMNELSQLAEIIQRLEFQNKPSQSTISGSRNNPTQIIESGLDNAYDFERLKQDAQIPDVSEDTFNIFAANAEFIKKFSGTLSKSDQVILEDVMRRVLTRSVEQEYGGQPIYMPEMDSRFRTSFWSKQHRMCFGELSPVEKSKSHVVLLWGYTFTGDMTKKTLMTPHEMQGLEELTQDDQSEIEIYCSLVSLPILASFKDFTFLQKYIGLVPCIISQIKGKQYHGLSRRLSYIPEDNVKGKGKVEEDTQITSQNAPVYHTWFLLPFSIPRTGKEESFHSGHIQDPKYAALMSSLGMLGEHLPGIGLSFQDELLGFYLKFELESKKTTVFYAGPVFEPQRFQDISEQGASGTLYDPFIYVCTALSQIVDGWVDHSSDYYVRLRATEEKVKKLGHSFEQRGEGNPMETGEETEQLQKARELMLDLHSLRSYQLRQKDYLYSLQSIVMDSIEEHSALQDILEVGCSSYRRIQTNLRTVLSSVKPMINKLESAGEAIQSCSLLLSKLIDLRNNYSIENNTGYLARMAQKSREDEYGMMAIAEATRTDSQAMKTIALMTMLYLPGSFVATLFSMGLLNFDFDGQSRGKLDISTYWWLYPAVALPLTASTFFFFWIMQQLQRRSDIKRTKPELEQKKNRR